MKNITKYPDHVIIDLLPFSVKKENTIVSAKCISEKIHILVRNNTNSKTTLFTIPVIEAEELLFLYL